MNSSPKWYTGFSGGVELLDFGVEHVSSEQLSLFAQSNGKEVDINGHVQLSYGSRYDSFNPGSTGECLCFMHLSN